MRRGLKGRGQAGASIIELMMVVVASGLVIGAITKFTLTARGNMNQAEALTEMIAANSRISNNLRAGLSGCVALIADYGGSPDATAVRSAINATINAAAGTPKPVSFSAMAVVQDQDLPDLKTGTNAAHFGNELYYVSTMSPVTVTVWVALACSTCTTEVAAVADNNPGTLTMKYSASVDRVQFVAVYLTQPSSGRLLKNGQLPLRLVEWRSKPYVTWDSLSETVSGSAYRSQAFAALTAQGYALALDTNSLFAGNGYVTLAASGTATYGSVPATLGQSSWAYLDEFDLLQSYRSDPNLNQGRVSRLRTGAQIVGGGNTYSVAYNTVSSTAVPQPKAVIKMAGQTGGQMKVPRYAQIGRGGADFPGGFEVMVVGRSGSRELYLRHVLMASGATAVKGTANQFIAHESADTVTVANRY